MSDTPPKSAYQALRRRLKAFVRAYVETGVGTKALKQIGFTGKRPDVAACKLLAKPNVRAAIIEFEATMADEVRARVYANLRGLEQIANFDPRRLVSDDGEVLPLHELPDDVAIAIQGIEIEELFEGRGEAREHVGRVHKYKTAGKIEARKLIMQYQRVIVNQHELSAPGGGPIEHAHRASEKLAKTTDPNDAMATYSELIAGEPPAKGG